MSLLRVIICLAVLLAPPVGAWEQDGPYRFSGVDRVVAIGDVHGAYAELQAVLRKAALIDADGNWIAGDDHLVSVGDLLDRGDDSRAVMDLLMRLQAQAEAAGGRVHVVLGNHEVMNLTGDLGYVTPGEFASYVDLAPDPPPVEGEEPRPRGYAGHRLAFSEAGPYGAWLFDLPFAIVVNGTLYLHAGVSPALGDLSLEGLNEQAHADLRRLLAAHDQLVALGLASPDDDTGDAQELAIALRDAEAPEPAQLAAAEEYLASIEGLPFLPRGPVWNRRNAVCHPLYNRSVTETALERLGAERLAIGHTPTIGRTIQSRYDTDVLLVDTGMNVGYYRGHPSALVMAGGRDSALYTDLDLTEVIAQPPRIWARPFGMSDQEIERFLLDGEVIRIEDLPTGITKPQRVTLRLGDRQIRAVYKSFDSDPDLSPTRWNRRRGNASDRYIHDLVAYRLDRILGLHLVPPVVIREVNGREGMVQYWLENAVNERDRREQQLRYRGICNLGNQYALMNIFDGLIHNDDRNLTNVLYTPSDWKLWLIDHSRAFRTDRRLPDYPEDAPFRFTPEVMAMLRGIDEESLEPLREFLHKRQVNAILQRAERIVKAAERLGH